MAGGDPDHVKVLERLVVATLAPGGGRAAISALLADAHALHQRQQSDRTAVFAADQDSYYWEQARMRLITAPNSRVSCFDPYIIHHRPLHHTPSTSWQVNAPAAAWAPTDGLVFAKMLRLSRVAAGARA